jgi:uncharacterized protein
MKNDLQVLTDLLSPYRKILVAFSGGVDSTFLLAAAARILGPANVHAVTAVSETYPSAELRTAKSLAKKLGVRHTIIRTQELQNKAFRANPIDRCFHCKDELFGKLATLANKDGMVLCDATNYSDRTDYRPGRRAAIKWKVASPLATARLTKDRIRSLSRQMKLPTWNLPAQACLASRFPYGVPLTAEALKKVEAGERAIRTAGVTIFRLRDHGDIARIEIAKNEMKRFFDSTALDRITRVLKKLGWRYIAVDIEGYRCGSLNPQKNISS